MKFIRAIIARISRTFDYKQPRPIGRWQNDYCEIKTAKKIDWSNEDHCGPCGSQDMKQQNKKITEFLVKLKDP
jgi:hypothetical protein